MRGRLDGAFLATGVGPISGRQELIANVDYLGIVELLEGMHPALAAAGNAKIVILSSNSTTTVPGIPDEILDALEARDMDTVLSIAEAAGPAASSTFLYAGSKTAIAHWIRTVGVTGEWDGAGIRVNALAPAAVRTPLLEQQLNDPQLAPGIRAFPIPVCEFGKPEEVAQWAIFMLSPAANFRCGSVIFLDGGTDAYVRADSWPKTIPAEDDPHFEQRMAEFAATLQ